MIQACSALLELELGGQSEPFFEFGSSFNIAQLQSGVAINVVPDKAEAMIDMRSVPSQQSETIVNTIQQRLLDWQRSHPEVEYALEVLQSESAYLTNSQHEFVQLLREQAVGITGKNIALVANGAGSVGNVISRLGIPIVNAYGCESGNVHAPNEWLNLKTIEPVFQVYWSSLVKFSSGTCRTP